jgi:hypothetical protein
MVENTRMATTTFGTLQARVISAPYTTKKGQLCRAQNAHLKGVSMLKDVLQHSAQTVMHLQSIPQAMSDVADRVKGLVKAFKETSGIFAKYRKNFLFLLRAAPPPIAQYEDDSKSNFFSNFLKL